ncbi:MAG: formimidoylglutamase [Candidatus Planktophila sp.]|nr:formimidoylglutamase [Candidatus Planktophila sp.]MSO24447.1 formimidoylglutamase [Candidatus Planktophila sp.]PHX70116.1 MAG: formimidoylglutamase [Actinomycetota bacterium]
MALPYDPLWPRARSLFSKKVDTPADVMLVGVPASRTSLTPTSAHETPLAIRQALLRYSNFHTEPRVSLEKVSLGDAGDITSPDDDEAKSIAELRTLSELSSMLIALGGDNSITYSAVKATAATGLITLDAHYDLRDGISNGSPVRRLIKAGLSGKRVVQIGIADFSNSIEYAKRAKDYGITVIPRSQLRRTNLEDIWATALSIAGDKVFVDFDMDVCDRSVVPACPAAAPGGISADELRQFAFLAGASPSVIGADITEIDPMMDSGDERTVRLAALAVLEMIAGFSTRS